MLASIVLFSWVLLQAAPAVSPEVQVLLAEGQQALQQGELAKAQALFEKAELQASENPAVHYGLGDVHTQRENYAQAIAHFRKAIELAPGFAEPYYRLAEVQAKLERYHAARQVLQQLLEVNPDQSETYLRLGRLAAKSGEQAEAEQFFRRYVERNPEEVRGLGDLGVALLAQEKFEQAETYLLRALEKEPRSGVAHYNLGLLYSRRGEHGKARRHLEEAAKLLPEDAGVHYRLGSILQRLGELEKARAALEDALALDPTHLDALYALGTVLRRLGDADEADKIFARHKRLSDEALEERQRERRIGAYHLSARELLEDNRLGEARDKLEEILVLDAEDALAHYRLGQISYLERNYRQALAAAQAAIERRSYEPAFHMLEGMCRERLGDPEGAKAAYERVVELSEYAEAHGALGRIALKEGNTEKAIGQLRRAVELEPENTELRFTLVEALRRAGRVKEAQQELSVAESLRKAGAPR